jgi:hypothetical protein
MLTKWGAALGLASAGRIASGGGGNTGVPLGPFNDWSELPASAAGGSLALLLTLGPANSSGLAVYDTGDAEWKLQLGTFEKLADLLTFTDPINSQALATVGTLFDDPESVRYQWDGSAWLRTPDPVEYIYAATDWANLPTQDTIQADDEAVVASLGLGNAYGRAVYDGTDWLLSRAWFDTVADMTAFAQPKSVGALAAVEASASDDENAVRYQWNGSAWARTAALTAGYAWDITDLTNIDPSGVGATQIGDFARYTNPTTGAVAVYRLRSVPAVGSINLTVWVPASIYGEANLTIRGYLIGNEAIPASGIAIQGYTPTYAGSSTVTSSSGEIVLTSTVNGQFANVKSTYVLQTADRFYIRRNLRLTQTAGQNLTFYDLTYANGAGQPWFVMTQNPTKSTHFVTSDTSANFVGSTLMIRGGGSALPSATAELVEFLSDGSAATDMVNVSRNARPYLSMRKNAQTGTETGQHLIQVFNGASVSHIARFSQLYFMTY